MNGTTRKLTNDELRRWGEALNPDNDWEGIASGGLYEMMLDTAGNKYDAGEADWDFDITDAERMLAIFA